jgi:hypothetical protein
MGTPRRRVAVSCAVAALPIALVLQLSLAASRDSAIFVAAGLSRSLIPHIPRC